MTRRFYAPDSTLTLEQHRALDLTRPYTDGAIGGMTDGRRSNDAFLSSLFADPSPMPVFDRNPPALAPVRPSKRRKPSEGTHTTPQTEESK